MIMIPLPFLFAAFAAFFLIRGLFSFEGNGRNWHLMLFLICMIAQTLIVGTRFGYDVEWLGNIQRFTAPIAAPLVYFCFWRPSLKHGTMVALLPLIFVAITYSISFNWVDGVLALNNIVFAGALIHLGFEASKGGDGLSWVGFGKMRNAYLVLWALVVLLLLSGLTDALIFWDFWQNSGSNLQKIIANTYVITSIIGVVMFLIYLALPYWATSKKEVKGDVQDVQVFSRIEQMMHEHRIFLDPDLSLSRIAKKLTLPVRDVSKAINTQFGCNVSQYVNELRVNEACEQMARSSVSILDVLYGCGFNTKSNFNREFVRVMDSTPSEWRKRNKT